MSDEVCDYRLAWAHAELRCQALSEKAERSPVRAREAWQLIPEEERDIDDARGLVKALAASIPFRDVSEEIIDIAWTQLRLERWDSAVFLLAANAAAELGRADDCLVLLTAWWERAPQRAQPLDPLKCDAAVRRLKSTVSKTTFDETWARLSERIPSVVNGKFLTHREIELEEMTRGLTKSKTPSNNAAAWAPAADLSHEILKEYADSAALMKMNQRIVDSVVLSLAHVDREQLADFLTRLDQEAEIRPQPQVVLQALQPLRWYATKEGDLVLDIIMRLERMKLLDSPHREAIAAFKNTSPAYLWLSMTLSAWPEGARECAQLVRTLAKGLGEPKLVQLAKKLLRSAPDRAWHGRRGQDQKGRFDLGSSIVSNHATDLLTSEWWTAANRIDGLLDLASGVVATMEDLSALSNASTIEGKWATNGARVLVRTANQLASHEFEARMAAFAAGIQVRATLPRLPLSERLALSAREVPSLVAGLVAGALIAHGAWHQLTPDDWYAWVGLGSLDLDPEVARHLDDWRERLALQCESKDAVQFQREVPDPVGLVEIAHGLPVGAYMPWEIALRMQMGRHFQELRSAGMNYKDAIRESARETTDQCLDGYQLLGVRSELPVARQQRLAEALTAALRSGRVREIWRTIRCLEEAGVPRTSRIWEHFVSACPMTAPDRLKFRDQIERDLSSSNDGECRMGAGLWFALAIGAFQTTDLEGSPEERHAKAMLRGQAILRDAFRNLGGALAHHGDDEEVSVGECRALLGRISRREYGDSLVVQWKILAEQGHLRGGRDRRIHLLREIARAHARAGLWNLIRSDTLEDSEADVASVWRAALGEELPESELDELRAICASAAKLLSISEETQWHMWAPKFAAIEQAYIISFRHRLQDLIGPLNSAVLKLQVDRDIEYAVKELERANSVLKDQLSEFKIIGTLETSGAIPVKSLLLECGYLPEHVTWPSLDSSSWLSVTVPPSTLVAAIKELQANSRKYSRGLASKSTVEQDTSSNHADESRVVITWEPRSGWKPGQVTLRFTDSGPGIQPELIRDDGQVDTPSNVERKEIRGLETVRKSIMAVGGHFSLRADDMDDGRIFPEVSLMCSNPDDDKATLGWGVTGVGLDGLGDLT